MINIFQELSSGGTEEGTATQSDKWRTWPADLAILLTSYQNKRLHQHHC